MIDPGAIKLCTFDCYGTLVDWESGLLAGVRPVLERHGATPGDAEIIGVFAREERDIESGSYTSYREVCAENMRRMARSFGVSLDLLPASFTKRWWMAAPSAAPTQQPTKDQTPPPFANPATPPIKMRARKMIGKRSLMKSLKAMTSRGVFSFSFGPTFFMPSALSRSLVFVCLRVWLGFKRCSTTGTATCRGRCWRS